METPVRVKLNLKEWRQRKGLKQREMAKKLCIAEYTYKIWERDITNIKVKQLLAVCDILGIRLQDIDLQEVKQE